MLTTIIHRTHTLDYGNAHLIGHTNAMLDFTLGMTLQTMTKVPNKTHSPEWRRGYRDQINHIQKTGEVKI